MEKLYKLTPLVLLCAFTCKMLIAGISFASVGALAVCAALVALQTQIDKSTSIRKIETIVSEQNATIKNIVEHVDSVRASMSSLKLSQGMKKTLT